MKKVDEDILRKLLEESGKAVLVLYDVEDVARLLGVSIRTVRYWIQTKQLRASKLGKRWKVDHDDLADFVNSRQNIKEGKETTENTEEKE